MQRKPKLTLMERERIFGWLHEATSLRTCDTFNLNFGKKI
jgi:hypothetical protein